MDFAMQGIPDGTSKKISSVFISRVESAYQALCKELGYNPTIVMGERHQLTQDRLSEHHNDSKDVSVLDATAPDFTFDQLILPEQTLTKLKTAVQILAVEHKIFDDWGLRKIEPHPKAALNFFGPPGTGKTLAAHAIASSLDKKIIIASYAEIESKYHGDGPKNVKTLFGKAEEQEAVLFIDEADSLLSKRLTHVTQGSEQAINSMRSQLLICLEQFHGIVIFATNLVENYDRAFETRIQHIPFELPDRECRRRIWRMHLVEQLPLTPDVNIDLLSEIDGICGRDIRNAVIQAAIQAAIQNSNVSFAMLQDVLLSLRNTRIDKICNQTDLPDEECKKIENALQRAFPNN